MATSGIINMGLIAVLVVLLCGGATAQSGCTQAIISMSSCLNYITGNSSTPPSSSCCSQLGNVVQSQPQCLCSVLNSGGAALGIAINQTLALALPGACNLQTPSVSQCNAASGPTTSGPGAATPSSSPVGSPSDDSPDIPTTPSESNIPSGSGSGSKTVPSTNGSSSNGSNMKAPLHLVVFVLFILSCASTATRF